MPQPKRNHRLSKAPRPHERRATGAYPYFRLSVWDPISMVYRDKPKPYDLLGPAMVDADAKGYTAYKIWMVLEDGTVELAFHKAPQPQG